MTDQSINPTNLRIRLPLASILQRGLANLHRSITTRRAQKQSRAAFMRTVYLDDTILDDIGVTRAEVDWALALPLRINASQALLAKAQARRTAEITRGLPRFRNG